MTERDLIVLVSVLAWPAVALLGLCAAICAAYVWTFPFGTIAQLRAAQASVAASTALVADLQKRVSQLESTLSTAWGAQSVRGAGR